MTKAERDKARATKERNHDTYVARTYGLSRGEYAARLASQGGGCAICGKKPRKRYLAVDHDHYTGRVRGLLCFFCNTSIGTFEFDGETARRASEYLASIADDLRNPLVDTSSPPKRVPLSTKGDDDLGF